MKTFTFYIGSTLHFRARRLGHWSTLRTGKHSNRRLQAAWATYGEESFRFFTVQEESDERKMLIAEAEWFERLTADGWLSYNKYAPGWRVIQEGRQCKGFRMRGSKERPFGTGPFDFGFEDTNAS